MYICKLTNLTLSPWEQHSQQEHACCRPNNGTKHSVGHPKPSQYITTHNALLVSQYQNLPKYPAKYDDQHIIYKMGNTRPTSLFLGSNCSFT